MRNIPKVIAKFRSEIRVQEAEFRSLKSDPPLKASLPPISGSIYWAGAIMEEMDETKEEMAAMREVRASGLIQHS